MTIDGGKRADLLTQPLKIFPIPQKRSMELLQSSILYDALNNLLSTVFFPLQNSNPIQFRTSLIDLL
jgi:hypothetical protein